MSAVKQGQVLNTLLRLLPADAFAQLSPLRGSIDLPLNHALVHQNQPTSDVCFIERGLASVVASSTDDETIEVRQVGREGTSVHVLLAVDRTSNVTFMQVAWAGIILPADELIAVLRQRPALHQLFLRYVHCCELQLAQSALANARYSVHERLARWLLMCHDRLDGNDLPLTHEFLSIMLGVRRSGVTDQIHMPEGTHAINATRGNVRIIDRQQLEQIAGGCYGVPEQEIPASDRSADQNMNVLYSERLIACEKGMVSNSSPA